MSNFHLNSSQGFLDLGCEHKRNKLNCLKYAHQKGPCAKHGKRRRKGTNSHTSVFIYRLQTYFFSFERSFLLFLWNGWVWEIKCIWQDNMLISHSLLHYSSSVVSHKYCCSFTYIFSAGHDYAICGIQQENYKIIIILVLLITLQSITSVL